MEDRPLGNKYSPYPGDIIPAKLEPGEFVMNRNAVADIGVENLKAANDASPRYPQEMSEGGFMDNINKQRQIDAGKKYRRNMKVRDATLAREGSMIDARMEKAKRLAGSISAPQLRRPVNHIDLHAIKEIPTNPEFNIDEWNGMMGPMSQNLRSYQTAYDEKQREIINREKNIFQNVPLTQGEIDRGNRTSNIMRNAQQNDRILQHEMALKSESGRRNDEQARLQSQQGSREIVEAMREQAYLAEMQDPGVGPKMKYGPDTIRGIDPKRYVSPKGVKAYTPAQQLMEQMNQKRNKKYNTHIDEDNPAIKKIYKDNPLMELERLNRKDNLQQWSDDRVQKIKDDVAMEYSPENLWNADIRDELIGDPSDPSDDYGSSLADAKKRSADRALLREQNRDIEMMNPGSRPKYVTKKGGYGATREEWIKEQQEGVARHKERMADQRMSKEGLRLGSQKEYDEWSSPNPTQVAHKPLPKPEKGSLRAALRDFTEGYARGKHGTLDNDYDYQTGGTVRHYGLGDLVKQGQETWGDITQTVGDSASAIADAAGKRYGGGFRKGQNVAGERYLGETLEGFGDMDRDQQIAMSKELRDTGGVKHIMTDQEKRQMWGQGVEEAGSQIGQDIVGGAKAIPGLAAKGVLGAGAATLGAGVMGVQGAGKLASAGYKGAKQWLDDGGINKGAAKDYKDVWSGKEKGSIAQRGKKGLGLLGGLLQDASTAQGFEGAREGYYDGFALGKGGKKKADGTPVVPAEAPSTAGEGETLNMDIIQGKTTPVEKIIEESDYNPDKAVTKPAESQVTTSVDAEGNPLTIDTGAGVIENVETGTIAPSSSTSGGNTNILNTAQYNSDGTLNLAPAPEASDGTMTVDDIFKGTKPIPLTDEEMPDFEESEIQRGGPIGFNKGGQAKGDEKVKFFSDALNKKNLKMSDLWALENQMGKDEKLVGYDDVFNTSDPNVEARQELAGVLGTRIQGELNSYQDSTGRDEVSSHLRAQPERSVMGIYDYPGGIQTTLGGLPMMDPITVTPEGATTDYSTHARYGGQRGGHVSMDGFIRQSWRNL